MAGKKRKTSDAAPRQPPIPQPALKPIPKASGSGLRKLTASTPGNAHIPAPPKPSNILKNLASIKQDVPDIEAQPAISRSTAFNEQAVNHTSSVSGVKRDEDLALIEELEPGPYEHTPPSDDPTFEKVEPHSGIALK